MSSVKVDLVSQFTPALREAVQFVTRRLKENKYQAYLVGGSVRDLLLGKPCSDLDFTTDATPQRLMELFPRHIPVSLKFGTIMVLYKKNTFEVTTYRTDFDYQDGRRPSLVQFGKTLEEDVSRRDFTINGMAYDAEEKLLLDYVGGRRDLERRCIQTIGSPVKRFQEDGLRPIRACRFSASLGFSLEKGILPAALESAHVIRQVAAERFYDEWRKTSSIQRKDIFWKLIHKMKISAIFFKEFHLWKEEEIVDQFCDFLRSAVPSDMSMYFAYLLYFEYSAREMRECPEYLGYPINTLRNEIRIKGRELKFSSADTKKAFEYLSSPLFRLVANEKISLLNIYPLAYFLSEISYESLNEHIHFFSTIASYGTDGAGTNDMSSIQTLLRKKVDEIQHKKIPIQLRELAVKGDDLKKMGYKGANIGYKLRQLHKLIIRYPHLNHKKALLAIC